MSTPNGATPDLSISSSTPAAPIAPDRAPPAPAIAEGSIVLTSEQMADRLERERKTYLKKMGFSSEQELSEMRTRQTQYETQQEEARRAQLSEVERYKQDLETTNQRLSQAEERLAAAAFERRVSSECAAFGARNLGYAMFEVIQATDALPNGETLDLKAFMTRMAADPVKAAALGIRSEQPVEVSARPVHTSPVQGQHAPPPAPKPSNPAPEPENAFKLDDKAWQARKQALGLI